MTPHQQVASLAKRLDRLESKVDDKTRCIAALTRELGALRALLPPQP